VLALWEEAPPAGQAGWDDVEIWFGLMSRKVLRGANFRNGAEWREAIQAFIAAGERETKGGFWYKVSR
jgi:hypothetical protein